MMIDRSGFLLMAGSLAAGGVGGWLAHDSKAHRDRLVAAEPLTAAPSNVVTTSPPTVTPVPPAALAGERAPAPAPQCDDSAAIALPPCPPMGPVDEGACTNFAARRCAEFKSAFKPRVAQAAVSCLKNLKANALCDPTRVNLCGHAALMAGCQEPLSDAAQPVATPTQASTSPVLTACEQIIRGCAGELLAPTLTDCRQTLSGMSEFGRASMIACMATHCGDKGLVGCEGIKNVRTTASQ